MTTKDVNFWINEEELKTPIHDEMVIWAFNNSFKIIKELFKDSLNRQCFFFHNRFSFDWENKKVIRKTKDDYNPSYQEDLSISKLIKEIKINLESNYYKEKAIKQQELLKELLEEEKLIPGDYEVIKEKAPKDWESYLKICKKIEYSIPNNYNIGFIDLAIFLEETEFKMNNFSIRLQLKNIKKAREYSNTHECEKEKIHIYIEVKPNIKSIGEVLRQISYYKKYLPTNSYFVLLTKTKDLKEIFQSQDVFVYEYEEKKEGGVQKEL